MFLTADSLRMCSLGLTTKISTRFTLGVFLVCVDKVFQKLKCCVDKFLREFLQKLNISWFNRIHLKGLISRKITSCCYSYAVHNNLIIGVMFT